MLNFEIAYTIFLEYINMSEDSMSFVDRPLCSYKNWMAMLFPCESNIVLAVSVKVLQALGSDDHCCAVQQAKMLRRFGVNLSFVQGSSLGNISVVLILV